MVNFRKSIHLISSHHLTQKHLIKPTCQSNWPNFSSWDGPLAITNINYSTRVWCAVNVSKRYFWGYSLQCVRTGRFGAWGALLLLHANATKPKSPKQMILVQKKKPNVSNCLQRWIQAVECLLLSYLREGEELLRRWRWRSVRHRSENKSLCYSMWYLSPSGPYWLWDESEVCVCSIYVFVWKRWGGEGGGCSYDPEEGDGWNTVDGRGGLRFWKGAAEKLLLLNLQW